MTFESASKEIGEAGLVYQGKSFLKTVYREPNCLALQSEKRITPSVSKTEHSGKSLGR